ncbi:PAS domain S-box protein [Flavobacterium sp.]|uniref:PAS domain S-box protein n=1 Tax=Flavobacterium sp. TaxID=239 RepID=UPI002632C239|nr:PAS domain S-box protein [Flavobacterium sp.]MDG2433658.1 PAS domain S-box protein [Flavobacterium sp.]
MKAPEFNFNSETFNNIFPFYILIDENLSIVSYGKSLSKVIPEIIPDFDFNSLFVVKRPYVKTITLDNFSEITNQLVLIESKGSDITALRGQFEKHDKGFLFIGSPWFDSMDAVIEKKLNLHDFAFHDPLLDLLHVMNNVENSSKELKELLTTINKQKNDLKKANKEIHNIALFSTQNPDPLVRIDLEGNLIKTNPAADLLKSIVFEGIEYELQEFFKYIIHKIETSADRWIFEFQSNSKHFSFICKSLVAEGYINIYGRDITDQVSDQEELNKLSLVASTNKNGVVFTHPDGKIFWCNEAYTSLTGFSKNEVIGKTPIEMGLNAASNREEIRRMVVAFNEGKAFDVEILHSKKNGLNFWSKNTGQPILDSTGNVIQYFAMIEDFTAEKEKEEQLLLLSSIAEKNMNAVVICDKNGKIEWVNASFSEISGYSKKELIGKKPGHLLQGPESNQETVAYLRNQISNGLPFNCEILNYSKSQEKYWVRVQGQALHNKQGEVIKYFAIEEDISNEKEFNQQLIDSENRLTSLITNLQSGILLEDENRNILVTNKRFCDLFDIAVIPELMIGMDCEEAATDTKYLFKNPDQFLTRVSEILKNNEVVLAEEIELADGRVYERSFIPIKKGSKDDGHLWSYDDVTIKKNYKESLEAEKEKYSNIIANMNMGLLEVDTDDCIQFANQSFCNMSGYSILDLLGKKASTVLLKTEGQKIVNIKNKERNSGISDSYQVIAKTKSGEDRYWLISGVPNFNVNGKVTGSIGIHLDITEQKKLEIQKEILLKTLEKQNEQLNDYAQIVSHDLKSPLRSIHSLITWIKEDNDKEFNEQTQQYLGMIEDKVEKMDHLIQGILTYSKVESIEALSEKININNEIQKIVDIIHIPSNISVVIKKELPTINADRFRMQQLFQNIISNAVLYIDKPIGIIDIDFEDRQDSNVFSIKDNGPGIAPENQEKMFKIFQSFTNHEKSTGIGLSIVKRIIDNYNGKIWIESELGIGTTFFIQLPK